PSRIDVTLIASNLSRKETYYVSDQAQDRIYARLLPAIPGIGCACPIGTRDTGATNTHGGRGGFHHVSDTRFFRKEERHGHAVGYLSYSLEWIQWHGEFYRHRPFSRFEDWICSNARYRLWNVRLQHFDPETANYADRNLHVNGYRRQWQFVSLPASNDSDDLTDSPSKLRGVAISHGHPLASDYPQNLRLLPKLPAWPQIPASTYLDVC